MDPSSAPFPVRGADLGDFERLYETRSFSLVRVAAYATCALATALGTVFLYIGQKLAPASEMQGMWLLFVGLIFLLAFVCLLGGLLYKVKANRVALFRDGLAIEAGGESNAVRWDELQHYFNSGVGEPFRFSLLRGGELEVSNETAGFSELGAQIRSRAGKHILQREYANIVAGGRAAFGPLTLTRQGFRHGGREYAWQDIEKMYLHIVNGWETLTFETNSFVGTGARISAEKIPSVHVCLELIGKLAPERLLVTQG